MEWMSYEAFETYLKAPQPLLVSSIYVFFAQKQSVLRPIIRREAKESHYPESPDSLVSGYYSQGSPAEDQWQKWRELGGPEK